jgi:predicted ATP-dependent serine protease
MSDPVRWKETTRRAHGAPCCNCGTKTYRRSGVCWKCGRDGSLIDPKRLPEDYLTRCAEELMRRHRVRAEMLAKLGIVTEAA